MPGNRHVFSAAMNAADHNRWDSHWSAALQDYQQALAEFPDDVTARSGLGFCFMQTKQWQKALDEYQTVLQSEPGNVIALSKIAEIYGILNRRADAFQAYMHLADLYAQAGQGTRAEAAWQKAVQLSPISPEPYERLANYYFEKKDIAQMLQHRLAAARAYLQRDELRSARLQCEEVLRADGTNTQAQQLLLYILSGSPEGSHPASAGGAAFTSAIRPDSATGIPENPATRGTSSAPPQKALDASGWPVSDSGTSGNTSGGNTGIMGNMGSAGNYGGVSNPGPSPTMVGSGGGMSSAPQQRISANQVTEALQQAQLYQSQGRFNDAIDLCEQILQSGFDRPDARYFLGWLYQEQQRWDDAIGQFQHLLGDPDYALSCYYALGQCYRARGDLRTATVHFDEAVDRVNLDALTMEESDQLVQLCQEAAEAHRLLGEQDQALTVYNALLGFLRSRGWDDKVAQVEFMLQQAQNSPAPAQAAPTNSSQAGVTQAPVPAEISDIPEAPTMAFEATNLGNGTQAPAASPQKSTTSGELPDWLTGILNDDKGPAASKPASPVADKPAQAMAQPAAQQQGGANVEDITPIPPTPPAPPVQTAQASSLSWLTDDVQPTSTRVLPDEPVIPIKQEPPVQQYAVVPEAPPPPAPVQQTAVPDFSSLQMPPAPPRSSQEQKPGLEDLLNQIAGPRDLSSGQVAEAVLLSTAQLPEGIRGQVVRSMEDIQKYINHGLLNSALEECLKVINIAPQYLDVHQVLCEIYVRQGKMEQAITKYGILVDTYISNGRTDDAVATYRRILQLEPNNITYRMRLITLLSSHGNKEDLLRERTLAAESYLRLGYVDRAMTELEQALQENPASVPTRLNYALALQKLGRSQQAVAEYQRVLQVDPRNLTALVRWHIAMITTQGTPRSTSLEVLTRIRWQLRGEGQRNADAVIREYRQALEIYPNNADVQYALGQVYQQCGQFEQAIDAYTQATRDSAVEILARTSMAQVYLAQGKPEPAIGQLEQAQQKVRQTSKSIDPAVWAARPREEGEEHQAPEMEIALQLAKAYERTGRKEQMHALLRQVKQARPAESEVASTLTEIATRQGDTEGTLREYLDLVRHYRNNKQTDNAINVLNEMVRLAPQDALAHEELADIYIQRGLLDEGIAELRLLADIHLRNGNLEQAGNAIQRIGNIYSEMGNNEEALTSLFRAAELNPESMDLLREVVSYCLQQGRSQDAVKYQEQIARHYFETQQVKEAVAALQQLITIDRSNYDAYDMLGQTYQSVGEYEQASRVYRNLAKVNPGSSIARERLATLQELRTR